MFHFLSFPIHIHKLFKYNYNQPLTHFQIEKKKKANFRYLKTLHIQAFRVGMTKMDHTKETDRQKE